jgi:hypothetical protein
MQEKLDDWVWKNDIAGIAQQRQRHDHSFTLNN